MTGGEPTPGGTDGSLKPVLGVGRHGTISTMPTDSAQGAGAEHIEHRMKQRRKATHTTDEKGGKLKLRSKAEGRFAAKSAYVLEHGYRSPLSTQNCKLDCVH